MIAERPPMGWNSWDCYGASVNEEQLLGNARFMADHLKKYGYEYVVNDIQWYEPTAESTAYHRYADLCMDEYSRLIPAVERFPSSAGGKGFKPIADEIHSMGLKYGIHIMRGVPRQAVHRGTGTVTEGVSARDIASSSFCAWNTDMYGVDADAPGAAAYYDSLFGLYASWGVDFVKVDDIACVKSTPDDPYSARREIELISAAVKKCGREMVVSLSPGPARVADAAHLKKHANMWRMSDDMWDEPVHLRNMFDYCSVWQGVGEKGAWPDCDMLPLGRIALYENGGRDSRLTRAQQDAMMRLWCVFRSPLIIGGDLPSTDDETLAMLTDSACLDMQKNGSDVKEVFSSDERRVWETIVGGVKKTVEFDLNAIFRS